MKPQYQHELMTSFVLWFDNHLLQKGEAYSNQTGQLYPQTDDRLPSSYSVFASPYKQWVTDSSVTGSTNPIIPTSFGGTGRSNTVADNDAITGFSLSNVGNALTAASMDEVYTEIRGANRLMFRGSTNSNHRVTQSQTSAHSGKWEVRDITLNRAAWRSSTTGIGSSQTPFAYPWTVTGWSRVNAAGGSAPVFSDFLVSGLTGFIFDFENGRIFETGASVPKNETITGTFAVKDFNIYVTNDTEEDLILNSSFELNTRYGETPSGVKPYDKILPAIFINSELMRNDGFSLGGEDKTTNSIKAVVMAENQYNLDGALSIFADTRHLTINKIPFTGHPITEYGDLKNGYYHYKNLSSEFSSTEPYYIENVVTSKLSERAQTTLPGEVKVGFIDFEVSTIRFPRA